MDIDCTTDPQIKLETVRIRCFNIYYVFKCFLKSGFNTFFQYEALVMQLTLELEQVKKQRDELLECNVKLQELLYNKFMKPSQIIQSVSPIPSTSASFDLAEEIQTELDIVPTEECYDRKFVRVMLLNFFGKKELVSRNREESQKYVERSPFYIDMESKYY